MFKILLNRKKNIKIYDNLDPGHVLHQEAAFILDESDIFDIILKKKVRVNGLKRSLQILDMYVRGHPKSTNKNFVNSLFNRNSKETIQRLLTPPVDKVSKTKDQIFLRQ